MVVKTNFENGFKYVTNGDVIVILTHQQYFEHYNNNNNIVESCHQNKNLLKILKNLYLS